MCLIITDSNLFFFQFESQINGNIAEHYEHLHDSHNNYYVTFVTMGSIAFERLSETVYYKHKFAKYKSLLKNCGIIECQLK